MGRALLLCVVALGGRRVGVAKAHLESPVGGSTAATRRAQCTAALDILARMDGCSDGGGVAEELLYTFHVERNEMIDGQWRGRTNRVLFRTHCSSSLLRV